VKKVLLAAAVAMAAVAGLIVALVISSGSDDSVQGSPPSGAQGTTPSSTAQAPTTGEPSVATVPPATGPVDTSSVRLPPPPGPTSPRRRTLIVGVVDDALEQKAAAFAQTQVDISRSAGFDAAIVSATWAPGQRSAPKALLGVLRNVTRATQRAHMRLFVVVSHGFAANTPTTPSERADFAAFAGSLVKTLPSIRNVIVGNEPNLDTFWKPQFGSSGRDLAAIGYADLLARSYDAIKAANHDVQVVGGALAPRGADRPAGIRPTHSPTAFIRDLGAAYRASGRRRPLMDAFAFHPYMQASRLPPTVPHPENTSITLADYPKLVALLNEAFHDTDQRGATLPILYTEFGVQTLVPPAKQSFYNNAASPQRADSVSFQRQVDYYRQALALAYCQPTVRGIFVFHTFDESNYAGWQSGLFFADGSQKPSLPGFRRAVADLRAGKLTTCSR
jgi:hypothetical protein